MAGEQDAQQLGEVKQERRSGERPAHLGCSPSSRIPRSHGGWHRALASGPVAGSASYPLRSGCDVPIIVPRRGAAHQPQDLEEASDREHPGPYFPGTGALAQCRALLAQPPPPPVQPESARDLVLRVTGIDIERCPICHLGALRQLAVLPPTALAWDTS